MLETRLAGRQARTARRREAEGVLMRTVRENEWLSPRFLSRREPGVTGLRHGDSGLFRLHRSRSLFSARHSQVTARD
jgi:hypothetical protein